MSPESAAERALYERLTGDAALAALLGAGTRIFPTWPSDTLQEADFPRITFYCFGPPPRRPGFQRVRATLDLWAWPTGGAGGRGKVLALDGRVMELLDERHFTYGAHRLYTTAGAFRDSGGGGRLRRSRDITIEASPLT